MTATSMTPTALAKAEIAERPILSIKDDGSVAYRAAKQEQARIDAKPKRKRSRNFELNINGKRPISFAEACRRYTKRFTCSHVPAWAKRRLANGKYPAPRYESDLDWYLNTEFIGEGAINMSRYIRESNYTWPVGRYLTQPYNEAHPDYIVVFPPKKYKIDKAELALTVSVRKYSVEAPVIEPPAESKKPAAKSVKEAKAAAYPAKKQAKPKVVAPEPKTETKVKVEVKKSRGGKIDKYAANKKRR